MFGDENTFGESAWFRTEVCSTFGDCISKVWTRAISGLPIGSPFDLVDLADYSVRVRESMAAAHLQRNAFLIEEIKGAFLKREYDLRLFHLSVPHKPYASTRNDRFGATYFDNLEVADRDLEKIITLLENDPNRRSTVLIVTSDHWWREKTPTDFDHLSNVDAISAAEDVRIPFIVSFPDERDQIVFEPAFNTVITRD
jgi:hypothetical protein